MAKPVIPAELLSDAAVHLTPIGVDDLELMRTWRNRDEIRVWFNDGRLIEAQQQQAWYRAYLENPADLMFIVRRTADMKPVGTIALYRIDHDAKRAEVGRLIIAEGKGEGLGYAATSRACLIAFECLGIRTLELDVKRANVAARRIYAALGFKSLPDAGQEAIKMQLLPHHFVSAVRSEA
ncbi:GNAT family N-acetyltransferase [Hyphomicrobium denitrificans]|nr:GNAT family N-acetyltransferase [Hyphomicrobium denitrificans]